MRTMHPSAHTQERAVITSFRDKVIRHAQELDSLWRRLEAEPGDAYLALQLRQHHADLHRNLESYFAAKGSRSTEELSGVNTIIDSSEFRLSQLVQQIFSEVDRFEHAAADISMRYNSTSAPDDLVHVYADADDALIELQLYEHSWGTVMDNDTLSRLHRVADVLRGATHNKPVNRRSPLVGQDEFAEHRFAPLPHSSNRSSQRRPPVKIKGNDSSPILTPTSPRSKKRSPSSLSTPQPLNPLMPPSFASSSPQHKNRAPVYKRNGRNGLVSNGEALDSDVGRDVTGDPDQMTSRHAIQRTRTLRDMAQTAYNRPDDAFASLNTIDPPPAFSFDMQRATPSVSGSVSTSVASASVTPPVHATSPSVSKSPSASINMDHFSMNAFADPDIQVPDVSKNTSFASTLYHTNNARIEAISDAGVMLERSIVRGDGRCLFRSLARCRAVAKGEGIPGERAERQDADSLRLRAVEEQKRHQDLLTRNFVIEDNFEQYIKNMAIPQTFGGEPELLMLAKVLHVPIAVYVEKGNRYRQIQVYGRWYRGDPLRILYHSDGVHYDALLPVS